MPAPKVQNDLFGRPIFNRITGAQKWLPLDIPHKLQPRAVEVKPELVDAVQILYIDSDITDPALMVCELAAFPVLFLAGSSQIDQCRAALDIVKNGRELFQNA